MYIIYHDRSSEERSSLRKASRKLSTSSINLEESQMQQQTESAKLSKKSSSLTQMAAQTNALMVSGAAEKVRICMYFTYLVTHPWIWSTADFYVFKKIETSVYCTM